MSGGLVVVMLSGMLDSVGCIEMAGPRADMMLSAIAITLRVNGRCRGRRAVHHHRRMYIQSQAGEQCEHAEHRDHAITNRGSDTCQA